MRKAIEAACPGKARSTSAQKLPTPARWEVFANRPSMPKIIFESTFRGSICARGAMRHRIIPAQDTARAGRRLGVGEGASRIRGRRKKAVGLIPNFAPSAIGNGQSGEQRTMYRLELDADMERKAALREAPRQQKLIVPEAAV